MVGIRSNLVVLLALILFALSCSTVPSERTAAPIADTELSPGVRKVIENAREQIRTARGYTQDYFKIQYPGGDVPAETGACTDVVIRSFRNAGVDLQREVHEDMAANFSLYPKKWGLTKTDTNIDHRRVPNLQTYFARKGKALPVNADARTYQPGDVVSWDLDGKGMTHIGLVSDKWNQRTGRYMIIHNIGGGTNEEDRLFDWKVTGHYRWF
jgi:uncharacterized protein